MALLSGNSAGLRPGRGAGPTATSRRSPSTPEWHAATARSPAGLASLG